MRELDDILSGVLKGDPWSLGRLSRILDDGLQGRDEALARLHAAGGHSRVIGITGPPGAGKSTLISSLIGEMRRQDMKVAVLAVDPTSPFSGGAVLGDRVRMQEHAVDPGVFIRSVATRGHMGGLSRSVQFLLTMLDAAGFDTVILETVGVGQEEVEVKDLAHTTLFVTVPGLGDGIQAMKAGVLEIAHIFVVNKADRPMAEATVKDLQNMISMNEKEEGWVPPVLTSVASEGKGIDSLLDALDRHHSYLEDTGGLEAWRRSVARANVTEVLKGIIEEAVRDLLDADRDGFDEEIARVGAREADPLSVARRWAAKLDLSRG